MPSGTWHQDGRVSGFFRAKHSKAPDSHFRGGIDLPLRSLCRRISFAKKDWFNAGWAEPSLRATVD